MTNQTPHLSPASDRTALHSLSPDRRLLLAALAEATLVLGTAVLLVGVNALAIGLALGTYATAVVLTHSLMRRGYSHTALGLCNVVTLTRLALTAALAAPLLGSGEPSWIIAAVAVVALSLDGVDGWLARRQGLVSDFGARFDMEVDSALALVLALNAWAAGTTGVIVLLLGLPRYLFAAASLVLPWMDRPLPERFSRKAVCVVQLGTLIALQLPPVTPDLANPAVIAVAAMVLWSFATDVLWLRRAAR